MQTTMSEVQTLNSPRNIFPDPGRESSRKVGIPQKLNNLIRSSALMKNLLSFPQSGVLGLVIDKVWFLHYRNGSDYSQVY